MHQGFRLFWATVALLLAVSAHSFAQTLSPTPDPFIAQLTASDRDSYVGDISGNGRFVVIESNGDIATDKTTVRNGVTVTRSNADRNREIFLVDYAQRRIFQLTDTTSARVDATKPFFDSTAPGVQSNIRVEVSNNRPMLTFDPASASGTQTFSIVFSSNAFDPSNFNGDSNAATLLNDSNQEIWVYNVPAVAANVNLSSGAELPVQDLSAGTFTRITNTPQSRAPLAGTTTTGPFVADDNRSATINNDGSIIAFVSTRNLAPADPNNADANPEIFLFNRTSGRFTQATNTTGQFLFNENPMLSDSGTVLAFISNANLAGNNNDDGKGNGNAEIYIANFDGAALSNLRQATRTKASTTGTNAGAVVNILSPGRRMSRTGTLIAFESSSSNPKDNGDIQSATTVFVYDVAADSFTAVGPRAASGGDLLRFPLFTDYDSALRPNRLIFTSALNFRPDGTFPTLDRDSEGLNPGRRTQIFSAPLPFAASTTLTRLTNTPTPLTTTGINAAPLQPFASNTQRRMAFSLKLSQIVERNTDLSSEAFYLLTLPVPVLSDVTTTLAYFTGATEREVVPTATPPAVSGVAPGMLVVARPAASPAPALAPSNQAVSQSNASETARRPPLPIELNGVSVSVGTNGAAAGLYFVGNNPNQINFVIPAAVAVPTSSPNTVPVVINNNGNVIRTTVPLVPAQPDLVSTTNGAGGRVAATNITNPVMPLPEPAAGFPVMSINDSNQTVATVLEIVLTGVRNATTSQVRVTVGTTDISGADILFVGSSGTAGFDVVRFRLPASLAGAGDVPIVVSVTINGQTFTSRAGAEAPRIRIQ